MAAATLSWDGHASSSALTVLSVIKVPDKGVLSSTRNRKLLNLSKKRVTFGKISQTFLSKLFKEVIETTSYLSTEFVLQHYSRNWKKKRILLLKGQIQLQ